MCNACGSVGWFGLDASREKVGHSLKICGNGTKSHNPEHMKHTRCHYENTCSNEMLIKYATEDPFFFLSVIEILLYMSNVLACKVRRSTQVKKTSCNVNATLTTPKVFFST